jgi:hypothetical protein
MMAVDNGLAAPGSAAMLARWPSTGHSSALTRGANATW